MATKGAPMPKKEEDIVKNSMKLYSYLVCIAGLAAYPEHTRMFRQKDLMFTKIKKATGITNDTIKLYLYYLEENKMIEYRGNYRFNFVPSIDEKGNKLPVVEYRNARMEEAKRVYELRYKKEKDGVYLIPRPTPFIPIPEQTLEKLNNFFECSELELKLYLFCCSYHNDCEWKNSSYKYISFEMIRDGMKVKDSSSTANHQIRCALCFLKAIGLIDFSEGAAINRKNARIPSFKLKNVRYYIDYKIEDFVEDEGMSKEEFNEILKRISKEDKEVK